MDILSFDLEIYNEIKEGTNPHPFELIPSVAAYCIDLENVEYFWDKPHMTRETAQRLVHNMLEYDQKGYKVFGWNILSFDLPIIANWSGMLEECGSLALRSVDPMFTLHCIKGHFLSLDSALVGAKLETKLHQVRLNDGTTLFSMEGSKAPKLWQDGEYKSVMEYLSYDVWQPYKLAGSIVSNGGIRWTSKAGKQQFVEMELRTVRDSLKIKKPDQSWMTNPKMREDFYSWIPNNICEKELQ